MIRNRVLEWIEQKALLPKNRRIVAACSGGPDSLALVDLLDGLQEDLKFALYVAHLDHGLRGEESTQDADFVRDFCERRGLTCFSTKVDVAAEAWRSRASLEETGRRLRYEYLRKVAREIGGAFIATGHHRDDQAETVLLNLIRGSGARGLGGIRPRQNDIIRPLLCLTREDIEQWCQKRELHPRVDSSNADVDFRRNRIRHELIPLFCRDYNPALVDTLCRTADVLHAEHEFIHNCAKQLLPDMVKESTAGFLLKSKDFILLAIAVQRAMIRILLEKLQGDVRGIGFVHVEQIRELFLHSRGTKFLDLPGGLIARQCYQELSLGPKAKQETQAVQESVELQCPGETILDEMKLLVRCTIDEGPLPPLSGMNQRYAIFDMTAVTLPLQLRCRRPGDRFQALGAPGKKKLKKFFIDLKVPVEKRDQIPLVCDEAGILWVAGYCRSERAKVSNDTKSYIIIKVMPLIKEKVLEYNR